MKQMEHWLDGKHACGHGTRTGPVFDPATGRQTAAVPMGGPEDVNQAVRGARNAAYDWSRTSLTRRMAVLFRFRQLLEEGSNDLAQLVTAEHGKVLSDSAGEVARGLEVADFACGIAELLKAEHSLGVSTGVDAYSFRQPLGVVAGITPFNFPALVPLWMAPLAIACGNSFILKPSEKDPSASMWLAQCWTEAGLPDGVFQVVHGDKDAVDAILAHPGIDAVSFVGSTPVARSIQRQAVSMGKRVQALGGAKNHLVAMPDVDPDTVASALVNSAYGSCGERCMAVSVAVLIGDGAGQVVEAIRERAANLVVGPGNDPESDMGPLVTQAHRDRVASYLDTGVREGANLVLDGRRHAVRGDLGGFWLGPSLFDAVDPGMSIYQDEIFGPVLCVVRATTLMEAIKIINDNPYGNGAAVFTNDMASARQFEVEVEAGMVGVNVAIPVPMAFYGFGGWGSSIFSDHDIYGPDGVRFYTRSKKITSRPLAHRGSLNFPTNQ
ncbi:MAG: CoA-acylating methylmalonate-semialdehyde dehydrogenase [Actinobacteria bacterium]|nr:CoA-acylating methylmalonate-semialdehyde dehydrogenase [Actinomycetota bacterium]MCL5446138.1 CoA-acylating methylmalonate-semialdehyde dehydrogenase [Actinomycetota bacterium]